MAEESWVSFGLALKFQRRRLHLTQTELATKAGFSREYVKKIERGQVPPLSTAERLVAALEVSRSDAKELLRLREVSATDRHRGPAARTSGADAAGGS